MAGGATGRRSNRRAMIFLDREQSFRDNLCWRFGYGIYRVSKLNTGGSEMSAFDEYFYLSLSGGE